ncbi:MAG TPA: outer membrane beta-barrel protein, partial [Caulobacteraceae bacterium]
RWGRDCGASRVSPFPALTLQVLPATAIAVALGVFATPCAAQVSGLPSFGIQPPQITPGVDEKQIALDVTGAYDSNVARSDAALAAARGVTPQDFYIVPGGDFTFSHSFGRETIYLDGSAGYKAYDKNTFLNRSSIELGGGGVSQISICQSTAAGAYSRSQADLSYLPVVVQNGQPAAIAKDTLTNATVNFTATCGRTIGLAPTMSVSEVWVTNDNTSLAAIDAHVFNGSGGVTYRSPVFGSVTINGQYSKTTYPNRFVPFEGGSTSLGYQTTGGGITLARAVGSRLSGTLSVDYTNLEPGNGVTQGFSGITYNGDITYAVNPRLNVAVVAGREVAPSNEIEASFTLTEIYGVQASYGAGNRLSFAAGWSHVHALYEGLLVPVVLFNLTDQTTNSVYGNATYRLNRWLSVTPSVTYSQRTANVVAYSYTDVVCAVTLRSSF